MMIQMIVNCSLEFCDQMDELKLLRSICNLGLILNGVIGGMC